MGGSLIKNGIPQGNRASSALCRSGRVTLLPLNAHESQSDAVHGLVASFSPWIKCSFVVFSTSMSLENNQDLCPLLSHLLENKMLLCGKLN